MLASSAFAAKVKHIVCYLRNSEDYYIANFNHNFGSYEQLIATVQLLAEQQFITDSTKDMNSSDFYTRTISFVNDDQDLSKQFKSLIKQLNIYRIDNTADSCIRIQYTSKGFTDWGSDKQLYYYMKGEPSPIVTSIDSATTYIATKERGEIFRNITGRWYLAYRWDNTRY